MAKVSLRIYNREIESLIDQGHINEAIAHCHHILRTFSKHLATYRLLGKAHLELKRHAEAVDIFGRVLMAVPDDFVSHVGMSIINDEESKLDDAIWYMERAFEAQPSNAAIQGELQRLYGRRDGMEPPKIRMTRGALAHMYVQGELYPQAIAEIRAVLSEDPDRADMQVLLARAYFRGGQKADASDMCAQLLKRYQYSFDANRIMVDLLPATAGVAESTQVYRMRVGELDPYATFAKGSVFQSDEVADAAINLERLEYTGEEEREGQAWNSALGLASASALAAAASSSEPDWLTGGFSDTSSAAPASQGEASNEIPDFLRDAGWGESKSPEQPVSFFDEEQPTSGGLTPAEIPDWLKGQVPVNATPTPAPQPEPAQSIEIPDWLMDNQPSESAQAGNIPDWLKDSSSQTPASESAQPGNPPAWLNGMENKQSAEPMQESNTPDWLSGLDNTLTTEPAQEENVADWLSKLDDTPIVESAQAQEGNAPDWLSGLDDKQAAKPIQEGDVPDWLSGLDDKQAAEPIQEGDVPDWLSGLDDKQAAEPIQEGDVPEWLSGLDDKQAAEPIQEGNVPDWLSGLDTQGEQPSQKAATVESLGSTSQEQDDAVAWLESLAAKHGAKPEELVTDPTKRSETPPEWVSQAQNLNQETSAATVESLGSTSQEQDDAVAWLESLAAKHGAKPEELVTDPTKRSETPPEWVSQAQSLGDVQSAPAVDAEDQKPEIVEHALNIGEQFFAEFESASVAEPAADTTSAWLKSLEEEEKQEQPVSASQDIPDWLSDSQPEPLHHTEIPEWLSDTQQTQDSVEQFGFTKQESDTQESDLPNWLSKDSDSQNITDSQDDLPEGDLANWLNSLDDEPGLPFDAVPTPDAILFSSQAAKSDKKSKDKEPVEEKSETPDWLNSVDAQSAEPEPEIEQKDFTANKAENLPAWLQEVEEEETEAADDDTPPWLHREQWEAEEPQHPLPTSPADWHPMEPKPVEVKSVVEPKQEAPAEAPKPFVPPPPQPSAQPAVTTPAPQPAAQKKKIGLSARKQQPDGVNAIVALNQAKGELDRGDIPAALSHYAKLIKKGKHLEETIRDLTESIYRYPVEVGIWQTLGDAYMRANRLKEALEAYNKAEELIR